MEKKLKKNWKKKIEEKIIIMNYLVYWELKQQIFKIYIHTEKWIIIHKGVKDIEEKKNDDEEREREEEKIINFKIHKVSWKYILLSADSFV